ncbi:MAG TPA: VWA domain-containing protein [Acidobacteriaceae bacterium]
MASAQTPPLLHQHSNSQPPLSQAIPLAAIWPQINLNIFVLDQSANPAPPIDPHSFQIFQDGLPRTIQSTAAADSPISLALLIDTSGSTRRQRPQVVSAASTLIDALPPGSEVSVVFFNDQAYCDLPLTPVSSFNPSVWQYLEARGGTAFYDVLVATENYFIGHAGHPRRALVAITDGGENASGVSLQQTVRALETPAAPLFFVLDTPTEPPANVSISPRQSAREQGNLRTLAAAGGGLVFTARSENDLNAVAAKIAAVMRSQIAVSYRASDADRDGRLHRLDVRLPVDGAKLRIYGQPAFYAPES